MISLGEVENQLNLLQKKRVDMQKGLIEDEYVARGVDSSSTLDPNRIGDNRLFQVLFEKGSEKLEASNEQQQVQNPPRISFQLEKISGEGRWFIFPLNLGNADPFEAGKRVKESLKLILRPEDHVTVLINKTEEGFLSEVSVAEPEINDLRLSQFLHSSELSRVDVVFGAGESPEAEWFTLMQEARPAGVIVLSNGMTEYVLKLASCPVIVCK